MDDSVPFVISGMTTTGNIKHLREVPYPWSSIWAWGAPNAVIPQGSIRLDASGKQIVSVPTSQTNQVFPEYQLCAQPPPPPANSGSTQDP